MYILYCFGHQILLFKLISYLKRFIQNGQPVVKKACRVHQYNTTDAAKLIKFTLGSLCVNIMVFKTCLASKQGIYDKQFGDQTDTQLTFLLLTDSGRK